MGAPATLAELFSTEDDERVALSVCAVRESERGPWLVVHATLLVAPADCVDSSWPEWSRGEGDRHASEFAPPLSASLVLSGDRWLLGRTTCDLPEAEEWFDAVWQAGETEGEAVLPQLGEMPELRGDLSPPDAMVRVMPNVDSPGSSLISGLRRPVQALIWPVPKGPAFAAPGTVDIGASTSFLPTRDIAGIHVTSSDIDASIATARGLLVGRTERRAWIRNSRGRGDFERYVADLGWDPSRVDLADLELTHIERLRRETVMAMRMRLEDLDTTEVDRLGSCSLEIPTTGRKVSHELVLQTADGELLDRTGPHPLVERIISTMVVDGHPLPPIVHGVTEPPPGLEAQMERGEQIAKELEAVIRNGAQARMLADRATAIDRLTSLINNARGELLVMDRYFGQDIEDWRLLDDVPVPVRVLTGKLAKDEDGLLRMPRIAAHVDARYRPKAPIHERVYLWEGGGISVGGSPTTFGQAPVRLARLAAGDAEEWRAEFEALWASEHMEAVPREAG